MTRSIPILLALALLLFGASHGTASTILISDFSSTDPGFVGSFVPGSGFGQTFKAPAGGTFADLTFTFSLEKSSGSTLTTFFAYLVAWDGSNHSNLHPVGPYLGSSGQTAYTTQNLNFDTYTPMSFNMGQVQLTEGQQYLVFLMGPSMADGNGNTILSLRSRSGTTSIPDHYLDGERVHFTPDPNPAPPDTSMWSDDNSSLPLQTRVDLNFDISLTLADVPEPSSSILLGIGVALASAFGLRKPRKPALTQ